MAFAPAAAAEKDVAMFGNTPSRNMVSDETGLPTEFDLDGGKNIKWVAELGSQELKGWLHGHMPRHMRPVHVRVLEDLPRTPTNKIQKYRLRDHLMAELVSSAEERSGRS